MILGTAGHIDHGKTALIKALTGVDTDRLKEEKARGISIDLGYAYSPLPDGGVLGFIDVPGHERFVPNMLAGVTGVAGVLLVVAADDGVMPQTREHLDIVQLLGIDRGVVALTKIDRASQQQVVQVRQQIDRLLAGSALAGSPVFALSSLTGEGVDALRAHLRAMTVTWPAATGRGNFRLAVDRSFTLTGAGTVVTGTVHSGQVRIGDRLLISPAGREVRVRSLHTQNRPAESGRSGQRCALNLAGIDHRDVRRGDWLLAPAVHAPSTRLDAQLRVAASAPQALRHWTPVHLHLGTADVSGRVSLLDSAAIAPGGDGLVQLVLDRAIGALHGDRFVLRDQSAQLTLAGGSVLDPFAPIRKPRSAPRLALLAALARQAPLATLLEAAPAGLDLDQHARNLNLDPVQTEALRVSPAMITVVAGARRLAFSSSRWLSLQQQLLAALGAEHQRAPERLGLEARQLRRAAAPEISWEVYSALLTELLAVKRMARHGPWLHLPGHRVRLTPAEDKLWRQIAPLLRATPFSPPWVRDIAGLLGVPETAVRALLKRATLIGDTYEILRDRFFTRAAIADLARIATELAADGGSVGAAEFRDRIGCGRKLAIQILEYFDRSGVSRRVGDLHQMRDPDPLVGRTGPAPAGGATGQISGRDSHPGGAT